MYVDLCTIAMVYMRCTDFHLVGSAKNVVMPIFADRVIQVTFVNVVYNLDFLCQTYGK